MIRSDLTGDSPGGGGLPRALTPIPLTPIGGDIPGFTPIPLPPPLSKCTLLQGAPRRRLRTGHVLALSSQGVKKCPTNKGGGWATVQGGLGYCTAPGNLAPANKGGGWATVQGWAGLLNRGLLTRAVSQIK